MTEATLTSLADHLRIPAIFCVYESVHACVYKTLEFVAWCNNIDTLVVMLDSIFISLRDCLAHTVSAYVCWCVWRM